MENQQQTLNGKKVVLLGASSGLGLETAKAAAAAGAKIIIVSSNQGRIDAALQQLPEHSEGYTADLASESQIISLFEKIGNFDHLVFTAGENIKLGHLEATTIEDARMYFNVRYWGAVTAVKYATPYINKQGSIVLTGGIAGSRPNAGWSIAASICSAMEGFTRAMAVELAPIRVNIVCPGVVRTNLWAGMSEQDREAMYEHLSVSLPVQRVGEAEDIAKTYLYLIEQPYSTGQTIIVDGGGVLV